jgi:hypothetical protein
MRPYQQFQEYLQLTLYALDLPHTPICSLKANQLGYWHSIPLQNYCSNCVIYTPMIQQNLRKFLRILFLFFQPEIEMLISNPCAQCYTLLTIYSTRQKDKRINFFPIFFLCCIFPILF